MRRKVARKPSITGEPAPAIAVNEDTKNVKFGADERRTGRTSTATGGAAAPFWESEGRQECARQRKLPRVAQSIETIQSPVQDY
jgi:hypothetical protein